MKIKITKYYDIDPSNLSMESLTNGSISPYDQIPAEERDQYWIYDSDQVHQCGLLEEEECEIISD